MMMLPERCPLVPVLGTTKEPKPPDLVPEVAVQACPACKPLHDRGVVKLEFANVSVLYRSRLKALAHSPRIVSLNLSLNENVRLKLTFS